MRRAYVIMSKWLSCSGIFKELFGSHAGRKTRGWRGGGSEAEKILNCGGRTSFWAWVAVQEPSRTLNKHRTSLRLGEMTKPDPAMPLDDDFFFLSFTLFIFYISKASSGDKAISPLFKGLSRHQADLH